MVKLHQGSSGLSATEKGDAGVTRGKKILGVHNY
jgi:hypothetical protein